MAKAFRWDDFVSFFNTLKSKLNAKLDKVENITYSALLAKVNAGTLTAGQQYRITDYVTTTGQAYTKSAGHVFDIIVTADSAKTLNHSARATLHEGDTYFSSQYLVAWKLMYDINNNTSKYAWASSSGKGVIYEMTDEYGNTAPYDFKNIQFRRYKITSQDYGNDGVWLVGIYAGRFTSTSSSKIPSNATINTGDSIFMYTFGMRTVSGSITDASLNPSGRTCYENIIEPLYYNSKRYLNNITFHNTATLQSVFGNHFKANCSDNWFFSSCYYNHLGEDCKGNTYRHSCGFNTMDGDCSNNIFGSNCRQNILATGSNGNVMGGNCIANTFGQGCIFNVMGDDCNYNTFGQYSQQNQLYESSESNRFSANVCKTQFATSGEACTALHACVWNDQNWETVGDGYSSTFYNVGANTQIVTIDFELEVIGSNGELDGTDTGTRTITIPPESNYIVLLEADLLADEYLGQLTYTARYGALEYSGSW